VGATSYLARLRECGGHDLLLVPSAAACIRDKKGRIIFDFRRLGVRRVSPCHCTGDQARRMFADAFGADCILAGVGQVISIGLEEGRAK